MARQRPEEPANSKHSQHEPNGLVDLGEEGHAKEEEGAGEEEGEGPPDTREEVEVEGGVSGPALQPSG